MAIETQSLNKKSGSLCTKSHSHLEAGYNKRNREGKPKAHISMGGKYRGRLEKPLVSFNSGDIGREATRFPKAAPERCLQEELRNTKN